MIHDIYIYIHIYIYTYDIKKNLYSIPKMKWYFDKNPGILYLELITFLRFHSYPVPWYCLLYYDIPNLATMTSLSLLVTTPSTMTSLPPLLSNH